MALTHEQKRYLKKNLHRLSLEDICKNQNLAKQEVISYLEKIWPAEKLNRYLNKGQARESVNNHFSWSGFLKQNYLSLIFLALLVIIAYANGLNNGFTSDDILAIPKNPDNRRLILNNFFSFFNLRAYVYWIVGNVFGINALYYRLFNLFYHLGTVLTLYVILSILISTQVALIAGAIIAVHPIFIESVTWLSGGHYAFSAFFCFLSLFFYILSKKNRYFFVISLLLYISALSILNKVMSFSAIILIYEYCFGDLKKNWKFVLVYFLLTGYFVVDAALQIGNRQVSVAQESYMPVVKPNFFIQLPVAITSYFNLLFWPDKLSLYQSELNFSVLQFIVRLIIFFGYIGVSIYSFFKNKFLFFWLAFFIIALSPTLTPFGVGWIFAERYGYLGVIGIIVVFAWWLGELSKNKKIKPIVDFLFIVIIISLTVRTIVRNIDWVDEDHLWIATARVAPSSPSTHNNLGDVYARTGKYDKALEEFFLVLKLNPNHADATHNIGNVYHMMGQDDKAVEYYEKALKMNPRLWQTNQNLGIIYFSKGQPEKAIKYMDQAIKLSPRNTDVFTTYGIMRFELKQYQEAKELLTKALQFSPENQRAREFLKKIEEIK